MSKYLFISGHCDDTDLSCGGYMIKLSEQGHQVHNMALSMCGKVELWNEFEESCSIMNIKGTLHNFTVREFNDYRDKMANFFYELNQEYDFVISHSTKCKHLDHRTVGEESVRVFSKNLLTYIQPWNGAHDENYFVELSAQQLDKKIEALACYKSQAHRPYLSADFIRSWAIYNGVRCGKKFAESFRCERFIT
jgi:LmbE family N-acetylglucosaminyl deacetylase